MSFARWVRGDIAEDITPLSGSLVGLNLKAGDVVVCTHDHGDCCWVFTPGVRYTVWQGGEDEELCLNGVDECFWDEVTYEFERVF